MLGFLKKLANESGQALPVVLALLAFGGLTIVPVVNYATSNLNSVQATEQNVNGLYAAEAGVEYTLWCLKNAMPAPGQLSETINQMQVSIQTEAKGAYTLCLGQFVQTEEHADYVSVSGEMVWDEGTQAYNYTITVAWQPLPGAPTIHLVEVGARLPEGYTYQPGSAAGFTDNLSTGEPQEALDNDGAYLLNWEFSSPYPSVSQSQPVRTQTFYITGEATQTGDYTWVVANRSDVGTVGEVTGELYRIISTATLPQGGGVTARVTAEALFIDRIYILLWQISK